MLYLAVPHTSVRLLAAIGNADAKIHIIFGIILFGARNIIEIVKYLIKSHDYCKLSEKCRQTLRIMRKFKENYACKRIEFSVQTIRM